MIDNDALRTCNACHTPYAWRRSNAALKFTYCNALCELHDLGFTIDGLIRDIDAHTAERRARATA